MAKEQLLIESHRSSGTSFVENAGWLLPERFSEPRVEYETVSRAAGLFDLAHRAMLQFTGPDRVSFLQGMLSNDVRILEPFQGQQSALLTQQGKVVADLRVLCA